MNDAKAAVNNIIRGTHWNSKFYGPRGTVTYIANVRYYTNKQEINIAMYPTLKRLYDNEDIDYSYREYLRRYTDVPVRLKRRLINIFRVAVDCPRLKYIHLNEDEYLKCCVKRKTDACGYLISKDLRIDIYVGKQKKAENKGENCGT